MSKSLGTRQTSRGGHLLVLCRANVIRSPLVIGMLEDLLRGQRRSDLLLESAGLQALPGAAVPIEVTRVALAYGVRLTPHRARSVTAEMLEAAGLIMTMTEAQRSATMRRSPTTTVRTFTFLELLRLLQPVEQPSTDSWSDLAATAQARRPLAAPAPGREDIPDPAGQGGKVLGQVAEAIHESCARLVSIVARGDAAPTESQ